MQAAFFAIFSLVRHFLAFFLIGQILADALSLPLPVCLASTIYHNVAIDMGYMLVYNTSLDSITQHTLGPYPQAKTFHPCHIIFLNLEYYFFKFFFMFVCYMYIVCTHFVSCV
jgi:hypothetical protein